jgi:hypothetical protein
MSQRSSEQSDGECHSPSEAGDSKSNTSPTRLIEEFPGQQDRHFSHSCYSSRSSSFNDSAAEVILGLFREDTFLSAGCSDYLHEDPAVQAAFIHRDAQNPDSWVSKTLARRELWDDDDNEVGIILIITLTSSEAE